MKLESESKTFKSTVQQLFLIFLIQQSYPFTFTSNSLDVDCSCELAITLFPPPFSSSLSAWLGTTSELEMTR